MRSQSNDPVLHTIQIYLSEEHITYKSFPVLVNKVFWTAGPIWQYHIVHPFLCPLQQAQVKAANTVNNWQDLSTSTAVLLRTQVFWNAKLCHWVSGSECHKGPQWLLLQHQAVRLLFLHCCTLRLKALWSFKTSETTYSATICHVPEDWTPRLIFTIADKQRQYNRNSNCWLQVRIAWDRLS
jgi:hypothetical protein